MLAYNVGGVQEYLYMASEKEQPGTHAVGKPPPGFYENGISSLRGLRTQCTGAACGGGHVSDILKQAVSTPKHFPAKHSRLPS